MGKKRGNTAAKIKATTTINSKKRDTSLSSLLQSTQHLPKKCTVETLVPDHVFVARNFLSKRECQSFVEIVESSNEMEYVAHKATRYIAQRECGRWQRNDEDTAKILFDRMQSILTQMNLECFPPDYVPVACNSNLRLYKYEKGMSFGKHFDGSNTVKEGVTEITVLVYLSECSGGATRFYPPQSKTNSIAFSPEEGAILLHIHGDRCLQHEADAVVSGCKYVLRTDVVYAKRSS